MKVTHQARITIALGASAGPTGLPRPQGINSQTEFPLEPTIAFSSTRDNTTLTRVAQGLEIYITELDGEQQPATADVNLASGHVSRAVPGCKKLTFDSNRLRVTGEHINILDLWVMDSDGAQQTLLLSAPAR